MFDTHKLNDRGASEVVAFKTILADAVRSALMLLPDSSRETSIFLTKLEEAVFFGTKAIASKSENYTETTRY